MSFHIIPVNSPIVLIYQPSPISVSVFGSQGTCFFGWVVLCCRCSFSQSLMFSKVGGEEKVVLRNFVLLVISFVLVMSSNCWSNAKVTVCSNCVSFHDVTIQQNFKLFKPRQVVSWFVHQVMSCLESKSRIPYIQQHT